MLCCVVLCCVVLCCEVKFKKKSDPVKGKKYLEGPTEI